MTRRYIKGWTLLELMVVIVIIGVFSAVAVPDFSRTYERVRLDSAVSYLEDIWTAQRIYWLRHRKYASSVGELVNSGLLMRPRTHEYRFRVIRADERYFSAEGRRIGRRWEGAVFIDSDGRVRGSVKDRDSNYILKP